jgi:hypothetical protein
MRTGNDIVRKSLSQGLVGFELLNPLHLLPIPLFRPAHPHSSIAVYSTLAKHPTVYRKPPKSAVVYRFCCQFCCQRRLGVEGVC